MCVNKICEAVKPVHRELSPVYDRFIPDAYFLLYSFYVIFIIEDNYFNSRGTTCGLDFVFVLVKLNKQCISQDRIIQTKKGDSSNYTIKPQKALLIPVVYVLL